MHQQTRQYCRVYFFQPPLLNVQPALWEAFSPAEQRALGFLAYAASPASTVCNTPGTRPMRASRGAST